MTIINQFHSIGDILFIEPICRKIWQDTFKKPILPVRDHLMWLSRYIESAEFKPMSKFNLDYESTDITYSEYLPLRFANQIVRGLDKNDHSDFENCMPDKYILAQQRLEDWKRIELNFDENAASELMTELKINEPYVLVNNHCQAGTIDIKLNTTDRIIYMSEIKGFTLIDWYGVILQAKEFHTVSTSTYFLCQAIHNKYNLETPVHIYPRPNEDGLRGISKIPADFNYKLVYNL